MQAFWGVLSRALWVSCLKLTRNFLKFLHLLWMHWLYAAHLRQPRNEAIHVCLVVWEIVRLDLKSQSFVDEKEVCVNAGLSMESGRLVSPTYLETLLSGPLMIHGQWKFDQDELVQRTESVSTQRMDVVCVTVLSEVSEGGVQTLSHLDLAATSEGLLSDRLPNE